MDIDLDNFKSTLPFIQKAIQEADFIAVDCELTGK
jgi:tRNA G26 N,N-dimethylase Trm1